VPRKIEMGSKGNFNDILRQVGFVVWAMGSLSQQNKNTHPLMEFYRIKEENINIAHKRQRKRS
jgi:hypothetical protein